MAKNVNDVVAKWTRNMQAAIPTIKAGVMAVTVSPMEKAAQAADLYARRVQEAVQSGRYQAGLRSVSLGDWQDATANKGSARISTGVTAAQPKQQAFFAQLLPFSQQVKDRIAAMPKGGAAEGDARALAAIAMMRTFKFQKRSA